MSCFNMFCSRWQSWLCWLLIISLSLERWCILQPAMVRRVSPFTLPPAKASLDLVAALALDFVTGFFCRCLWSCLLLVQAITWAVKRIVACVWERAQVLIALRGWCGVFDQANSWKRMSALVPVGESGLTHPLSLWVLCDAYSWSLWKFTWFFPNA